MSGCTHAKRPIPYPAHHHRRTSMASLDPDFPPLEEPSQRKNKRKLTEINQKLLVGESVEVRSTEEGFQGSWHPGSVIQCQYSGRRARYDHFLVDDESDYYTEVIKVSPAIEGVETPDRTPMNYRGFIRPNPPPLPIHQWGLHYGLCVDYYYNDAWWEGLVFDHEDGSEERLVFFPDIGDQQMAKFENLRITQDWDEASDVWVPRRHWVFLELIEKNEIEWPLFVFVSQLWYDLRNTKEFRKYIKEWTCPVRWMWLDLVIGVLCDNVVLTAQYALSVIEKGSGESTLALSGSEREIGLKRPVGSSDLRVNLREVNLPGDDPNAVTNSSDLRVKRRKVNPPGDGPVSNANEEGDPRNDKLSWEVASQEVNDVRGYACGDNGTSLGNEVRRGPKKLTRGEWLPAGKDLVPEAKYCPTALANYRCGAEGLKRVSNDTGCEKQALKLRMHLLYIGWKVQHKRDGAQLKYRYIAPNGKAFYSLSQVRKHLTDTRTVKVWSSQNVGHVKGSDLEFPLVARGAVIDGVGTNVEGFLLSKGDGSSSSTSGSTSSSSSSSSKEQTGTSSRSSTKEQTGTSSNSLSKEMADTSSKSPSGEQTGTSSSSSSDEQAGTSSSFSSKEQAGNNSLPNGLEIINSPVNITESSSPVIGSVEKYVLFGLVPCGGSLGVDSLVPTTNQPVPANDPETQSPVDITETGLAIVHKLPPTVEINSLEEVEANAIDVSMDGGIGGEKEVCDRDSSDSDSVHPLALSTTVIGSVGKSISLGRPCLRKEGASSFLPRGGRCRVDSLAPLSNHGVLYIPEDQLVLYNTVVQRYGPIYGDKLHKSIAYLVNLFVPQLMVVISAVNSCCTKTLRESVLEEWEVVATTALNLGFTVTWLRDHIFKLRAMWERNRMLDRLRINLC